jgi:ABC-2 type transport system permease protein
MNTRRTVAVFRKELLHIVRDIRSLAMALLMPLLLLLLFGFALSLDVDRIPTLIYDADGTFASRQLIEQFRGSRFFDIRTYVSDYRTLQNEINAGRVLMAIVIPPDYAQSLAAGDRVDVQILIDGSDSNTASIAKGYAETTVTQHSQQLRADRQNRSAGMRPPPVLDYRSRILYNSSVQSKNYIVPGLIAVILMIIAALLTSLTIAREWEMGTMEQLLSTPLRPAEMVLGKMLAFFVLGAVDTVVAVVIGLTVFDVPMRGSIGVLALSSCVFLVGALFWGILISSIAKNQLPAFQMGILSSFLPSFLLSGFIYSIENMPIVIQAMTYVIAPRHFVTILKGIFLKGIGIEVLWPQFVFLSIYAAVVFTVATRKLRAKLA